MLGTLTAGGGGGFRENTGNAVRSLDVAEEVIRRVPLEKWNHISKFLWKYVSCKPLGWCLGGKNIVLHHFERFSEILKKYYKRPPWFQSFGNGSRGGRDFAFRVGPPSVTRQNYAPLHRDPLCACL